jgi:uncharacterized protein YukJ
MTHARTKPASQQRTYAVLVGTIRDGQEDPAGHSPHYEIWVEADQSYRIAVNDRLVDGSDVLAHYDPNFTNPTKLGLAGLAAGAKGFTGRGSIICATVCSPSARWPRSRRTVRV